MEGKNRKTKINNMIIKEYKCETDGDFESGVPICPKCGEIAKRTFKTAVGLSFGKAKRIDMVIEGEFARRGISNYTNAYGAPKVDYGDNNYGGISAGWGKQQLNAIQNQYAPSQPLAPPSLPTGSNSHIPTIGETPDGQHVGRNKEAWGAHVPTEVMDLKPNA
jgi:hypothetical protein